MASFCCTNARTIRTIVGGVTCSAVANWRNDMLPPKTSTDKAES